MAYLWLVDCKEVWCFTAILGHALHLNAGVMFLLVTKVAGTAMNLQNIAARVYADYFMPNRLKEYAELISCGLSNNYKVTSVIQYYDMLVNNEVGNTEKLLVLRHDIDSDVNIAKQFWEIEKAKGVFASYYFRLETLQQELMQNIAGYGSEASYHYEELATYCKRHNIFQPEDVLNAIGSIQEEFIKNYWHIRNMLGVPLRSVASHGDWFNRKLGMTNRQLLSKEVRSDCGIEVECYDEILKTGCLRISDTLYPEYWKVASPIKAIEDGVKVICLLTHPRHWEANWAINTGQNITRIYESLKFQIMLKS